MPTLYLYWISGFSSLTLLQIVTHENCYNMSILFNLDHWVIELAVFLDALSRCQLHEISSSRWFNKVTFLSWIVGSHQQPLSSGHLINHPKKVANNCQVLNFYQFHSTSMQGFRILRLHVVTGFASGPGWFAFFSFWTLFRLIQGEPKHQL